jgi:hypothetical protein
MLAPGSFVDSGEPEPIVRPSGLIQGPIKAARRARHHSPVAFRRALGIRPGSSTGAICSVPYETEIVARDRKKTSDKEMPWPS